MAYLIDTSILARVASTADLLTFHAPHFARLASFGARITVVDPATSREPAESIPSK